LKIMWKINSKILQNSEQQKIAIVHLHFFMRVQWPKFICCETESTVMLKTAQHYCSSIGISSVNMVTWHLSLQEKLHEKLAQNQTTAALYSTLLLGQLNW